MSGIAFLTRQKGTPRDKSSVPEYYKNGRGEYVILDMKEYDRMKAELMLLTELRKGEQSAQEKGWLSADEVEEALGL